MAIAANLSVSLYGYFTGPTPARLRCSAQAARCCRGGSLIVWATVTS